jgi:PHP domain
MTLKGRWWKLCAALLGSGLVLVAVSLPPARATLETPFNDGTVPGMLHVHTNRSDGRGTPDDIAAAAARAGLKFIVFTDHGDGTRTPDPPAYRSGVLCLDAVEISTTGGHYLALDMPAAPYPLGGEGRDVVEDVKRLGGFGVAAHPNSPKPALSWRQWDAPFDGIEWLNPDTSWRIKLRQPGWRVGRDVITTLAAYPFRSAETMARLLGHTGLGVDRWESFAHKRRVVLLAGADAHANLQLTNDPGDSGFALPIPGYETSFRMMSVHIRPDRPLTGDATRDATTVMQAIRRGHLYLAIDGYATPPAFQFTATNARGSAGEGGALESGGNVTLRVRSNAPSSFLTVLWRDGERIADARDEADIARTVPEGPAIYRAEITTGTDQGSIPWIISNPIYVGVTFPAAAPAPSAPTESRPLFDGQITRWWRTEVAPMSTVALDLAPGPELRMRYQLSAATAPGPYAMVGVELPDRAAPYDRVTFTARADRPMRISVRFRSLGPPAEHWQRSVYLDETSREHTIAFDDVTAVDTARTPHPDPRNIHDILFVVETTNTRRGSSGQIWIRNVMLQR